MADPIRLTVEGIENLTEGLESFVRQLVDELQPGFTPESRYRGERGGPFVLEKIDLVSQQVGFSG